MELFDYVFNYLIKNNLKDLQFFLTEEQIKEKTRLVKNGPIRIAFRDALDILYKETNEEKYKEFSLKHFGTWEEVKLTEIL